MKILEDLKETKTAIDDICKFYPASVTRFLRLGEKSVTIAQNHEQEFHNFQPVNFNKHGYVMVHCPTCKTGKNGHRRQFEYYKSSSKNVKDKNIPCPQCLSDKITYFRVKYGEKFYYPFFKILLKRYVVKKISSDLYH